MHIHQTTHTFGDTVYLKTDLEQHARMVTRIHLNPNGAVYELALGPESSDHYDIEISKTPDQSIKLGITREELS